MQNLPSVKTGLPGRVELVDYANIMQGMRVLKTATSLVKVTIGVSSWTKRAAMTTARCLTTKQGDRMGANPWRETRSKMKWQRATNSLLFWTLPLPVTKSETIMMSSGRLLWPLLCSRTLNWMWMLCPK